MKLDRNQLAKDILLQHVDNMKSDAVNKGFAHMIKRSNVTTESFLARLAVDQADALLAELEK